MKKRILASTMASVMALSSVSIVAFADDTVVAPKTESVSKEQLKNYLDSISDFVDKELKNYGSNQKDKLENAIDTAKNVISDKEAGVDDATAAYQMVKAVKDNLRIYTAEELEDLIDDNKDIFESDNVLNESLGDIIYDEETYEDFTSAYVEALRYVDSADSGKVSNAYGELEDAVKNLKQNETITKTQFLNARAAYVELEKKYKDYEEWRRGACTVDAETGNAKTADGGIKLSALTYVTFGDLITVIHDDADSVTNMNVAEDTGGTKAVTLTEGQWIGKDLGALTVADTIEEAYNKLNQEKTTNKTSDKEIIAAYKTALDAVKVFEGWEADDGTSAADTTVKNLIKKYHDKMVKKYYSGTKGPKVLIDDLNGGTNATNDDTPAFKGIINVEMETASGKTTSAKNVKIDKESVIEGLSDNSAANKLQYNVVKGVVYYAKTVTASTDIDKTDMTKWTKLTLKYNSKTGRFVTDANGKYTETDDSNKELVIKTGMDLVPYLPVDSTMVDTTNYSGDTTAAVETALGYAEDYLDVKALPSGDRDWSTVQSIVDVLDTHDKIGDASGSRAEWTLVWRNLSYAFEDEFESPSAKYKLSHIKALAPDAKELLGKTENSGAFSIEHEALFDQYEIALEYIADKEAEAKYKDGAEAAGKYVALKDAYDDLNKKVAKYPVSYGEIADTIAKASMGVDDKVYGAKNDEIKALVAKVARELSTLDASDIDDEATNEAFDDDRVFIEYNRLYVDKDNATIAEKELYADYQALVKAMEDATAAPATALGDINGDGFVNPQDALAILKADANIEPLNDAQKAVADYDKNGTVNALDALAILKAQV